jgi:hypothetical protein
MAFPASCSVGIRKTDGVLARVGELCGIIRASYLSPFFPLVLGFELWRYLRSQLQTGDRAVLTRYNRFNLRLLRGAAFSVTLMLPAKGWAQGDGTLASPQTPAKTSETSEEVLKLSEMLVWRRFWAEQSAGLKRVRENDHLEIESRRDG